MSDVVVICATVLLVSLLLAGLYVWTRLQDAARATTVIELTQRLDSALTVANATPAAVLALSERLVVLEAAMKAAIAQMVNTSGYTDAKYQQLLASAVRGNVKGPKVGA